MLLLCYSFHPIKFNEANLNKYNNSTKYSLLITIQFNQHFSGRGKEMKVQHSAVYFLSVQSKLHWHHISADKKQRYENRVEVLGTCDLALAVAFHLLKTAMCLQELHFSGVYIEDCLPFHCH